MASTFIFVSGTGLLEPVSPGFAGIPEVALTATAAPEMTLPKPLF
jgi:hypothetical protein